MKKGIPLFCLLFLLMISLTWSEKGDVEKEKNAIKKVILSAYRDGICNTGDIEAIKKGSTPISIKRVTALGASLVCNVLNTSCPVSDALIAISAVSESLISPTITISGLCLNIDLRPFEKVRPMSGFTCIWVIPPSWYSTGSSMVIMFFSMVFNWFNIE